MTSRFLEYLQTKLVFRVYGRDTAAADAADDLARRQKPKAEPVEVSEEPSPVEEVLPNLPGEVSQGIGTLVLVLFERAPIDIIYYILYMHI